MVIASLAASFSTWRADARHVSQCPGSRLEAQHMDLRFFRKLVQWIREEFEAAPHLRLTTREAAAFLGLDPDTCERVLTELLRAGFLARGADDRYRLLTATR